MLISSLLGQPHEVVLSLWGVIVGLVNHILIAKRFDPDADFTAFEKEIDRVVYSLYDLSREEIEIVEATTE